MHICMFISEYISQVLITLRIGIGRESSVDIGVDAVPRREGRQVVIGQHNPIIKGEREQQNKDTSQSKMNFDVDLQIIGTLMWNSKRTLPSSSLSTSNRMLISKRKQNSDNLFFLFTSCKEQNTKCYILQTDTKTTPTAHDNRAQSNQHSSKDFNQCLFLQKK